MPFNKEEIKRISKARKDWEEGLLKQQLEKFGMEQPPSKTCTPLDLEAWDFLEKVGFPGQYPFTSMEYPTPLPERPRRGGVTRFIAGAYAGYGTVEDTRDLWQTQGRRGYGCRRWLGCGRRSQGR